MHCTYIAQCSRTGTVNTLIQHSIIKYSKKDYRKNLEAYNRIIERAKETVFGQSILTHTYQSVHVCILKSVATEFYYMYLNLETVVFKNNFFNCLTI